jgi:hypothetical protein
MKATAEEKIARLLSYQGWPAALIILGCPLLRDNESVWSRVSLETENIYFERMLLAPFSSGERRMLQIAASLYADEDQFNLNLYRAFSGLDDDNLHACITAIKVHVCGLDDPLCASRSRLEGLLREKLR